LVRVRVESGRIFDLYYDRAPRKAEDRKGSWFLLREMAASDEGRHSADEARHSADEEGGLESLLQ